MKIVIAMDSFKGSMTTYEAGNAVADGIKRVFANAKIKVFPMADGGEGSADVIVSKNDGIWKTVNVKNPVEKYINASYGIITKTKTAVIEIASAAGITLISDAEKNPMKTTTYGVGEMIKDAVKEGCRKFVVGIGGSATNDGGIGMLSALGFKFLDKDGMPVSCGAEKLSLIEKINADNVLPEIFECDFMVACDVQNPLCGNNGCSVVFGPQKGANTEMVYEMDKSMSHFEKVTKQFNSNADGNFPGSGAAGGLGFAFMSYLNASLKSGIDLIISQIGMEEEIKSADIVITGEGRLDGQSYMGKTPIGIATVAKKYNKTVLSFSGGVTKDAKKCNNYGIDAFFSILKAPMSLQDAMSNAEENMSDTVEQVFRLIKILL